LLERGPSFFQRNGILPRLAEVWIEGGDHIAVAFGELTTLFASGAEDHLPGLRAITQIRNDQLSYWEQAIEFRVEPALQKVSVTDQLRNAPRMVPTTFATGDDCWVLLNILLESVTYFIHRQVRSKRCRRDKHVHLL